MRRRLLVVIMAAVTVALLVTGLATATLLRRDDRQRAVRELSVRATSIAEVRARHSFNSLGNQVAVLQLETVSVYRLEADDTSISPEQETRSSGAPLRPSVLARFDQPAIATLRRGQVLRGSVGELIWAAAPAEESGGTLVIVLTRPLPSNIGRVVGWFAIGAGIALAIAVIAAAVLARRLAGPLRAAESATREIAAGDLSVRVPVPSRRSGGKDEVGDLARSINTMAAELERSRQLERQFLLSVSHDLRTPLTSIRGFAEAIAEGTAPDHTRAGEVISSEARRLERLVKDLLELAKLDARRFTLNLRNIDVTEIVTDGTDGFLPMAEREAISLDLHADDNLTAIADPERLAQVLANLIENAMKYARSAVTVSARCLDGGGAVEIRVADDGPGIAPADLPHIFERLYTSARRPTRQIGSGLGLAIVHELVSAMGATVHPETSDAGANFVVRLRRGGPQHPPS